MTIFFGLISIAVGIALLIWGYRVARIIIPLWGFIAGLSLGGAIISAMASTPFLGTLLGVLIGILLGIVFAVFAYLFYAAAIIVLAGALGYWIGSGFILILGFHAGLLSWLFGIGLGILVALAALFWNVPRYALVVLSSLAGALSIVTGILVLFHKIPLNSFSYHASRVVINNSVVWLLVTIALAIIGIVGQWRTTEEYEFEEWNVISSDVPPTLRVHHEK